MALKPCRECGEKVSTRFIPWPWPGPPPWVFSIAAELNRIANSAEAAGMQEGLLKVAGQVLQRGFGQGGAGAG
jgi:hypothetical protein